MEKMKYHIVLSRFFDLEGMEYNSQTGRGPRHVMWDVGQQLDASLHMPGNDQGFWTDKIRSKITSSPEQWVLARRLADQLTGNDVVFCAGEDVGYPLAALSSKKRDRPRIAVFIHYIDHPKGRLSLKVFNLVDRIDLFVTNTLAKANFLRQNLHIPESKIYLFDEQHIDIRFFTPGPVSTDKNRTVIGSGGLEQRDYRTLAAATQDLDLDVKICAVSPNAAASKRTFPPVLPENMSCRFYDWSELVQLYRDSDVVVISLFDHNYQAGLTTLFEAMACQRPVIMTRTPGIVEELADLGVIIGVQPGDADGMRQEIINLLKDPQRATDLAQRGYELVTKRHNHNSYVAALVKNLKTLPALQRVVGTERRKAAK